MLNILKRKGKTSRKKKGKAFYYSPLVNRSQVAKATLVDMIDRLFEGNPERLVQSLFETDQLKPEDLEKLKHLVNTKEEVDGDD
jgi:predicted transcriptional regulator